MNIRYLKPYNVTGGGVGGMGCWESFLVMCKLVAYYGVSLLGKQLLLYWHVVYHTSLK